MKTYQALRALTLPATLHSCGQKEIAIDAVFTVPLADALAAGRFLANRITMGDLVEILTPTDKGQSK